MSGFVNFNGLNKDWVREGKPYVKENGEQVKRFNVSLPVPFEVSKNHWASISVFENQIKPTKDGDKVNLSFFEKDQSGNPTIVKLNVATRYNKDFPSTNEYSVVDMDVKKLENAVIAARTQYKDFVANQAPEEKTPEVEEER
jgi:hypothetical protein